MPDNDCCSSGFFWDDAVFTCPLQEVKNSDTNSKVKIGLLNFFIVSCLSIFFKLYQFCTLSEWLQPAPWLAAVLEVYNVPPRG